MNKTFNTITFNQLQTQSQCDRINTILRGNCIDVFRAEPYVTKRGECVVLFALWRRGKRLHPVKYACGYSCVQSRMHTCVQKRLPMYICIRVQEILNESDNLRESGYGGARAPAQSGSARMQAEHTYAQEWIAESDDNPMYD